MLISRTALYARSRSREYYVLRGASDAPGADFRAFWPLLVLSCVVGCHFSSFFRVDMHVQLLVVSKPGLLVLFCSFRAKSNSRIYPGRSFFCLMEMFPWMFIRRAFRLSVCPLVFVRSLLGSARFAPPNPLVPHQEGEIERRRPYLFSPLHTTTQPRRRQIKKADVSLSEPSSFPESLPLPKFRTTSNL